MKIFSCNATEETGERLKNLLPQELENKPIALNLGYSDFKEIEGYKTLNPSYAVKNCVNKKEMFKTLKKSKIKCLKFFDLNTIKGKFLSLFCLLIGKEIVLRSNGIKILKLKDFSKILKNKDYATIKENKILEYRLIVFKNKIIRGMVKINKRGDFIVKQSNSRFKDIDLNKISEKDKQNIINSSLCLGLDLSGVDVLVNNKGKFKIIEVNSGMALCSKSIDILYKYMINYFS